MKQVTYKKSGVDIDAADRFVQVIKPWTQGIGGFGGLFKFEARG